MKPITARAVSLTLPLVLCLACCTGTGPSAAPNSETNGAAMGATAGAMNCPQNCPMTCPISGEPVTTESPSALYGVYPVYCTSVADAKQFASLAPKKRAVAATAQVLPQKGIRNRTCPLTGESLTAAAAPVNYDGEIIGFASVADANQFKSLAANKKAELIAEWKRSGDAPSN